MTAELLRHPREMPYAWRWLQSLLPGHTPLVDRVPWVTFRAIDWIDAYLSPDMQVFEYGAGGSTLYFAQRVRTVVSVEHDAGFYDVVGALLRQRQLNNCLIELQEPRPCTESSRRFASFQPKYLGMCFESYVKSIDRFPDRHFDLVLVDGRARVACVERAKRKVKLGGALVLDNTDRPDYARAYEILGTSTCHDLEGLTPWNMEVSKTSVWTIRA
jgi:tRNA A58 N-methylase Trm61